MQLKIRNLYGLRRSTFKYVDRNPCFFCSLSSSSEGRSYFPLVIIQVSMIVTKTTHPIIAAIPVHAPLKDIPPSISAARISMGADIPKRFPKPLNIAAGTLSFVLLS